MLVNKKVLSALKNALNIGMVAESAEAIPIVEAVQPVVQVDDLRLTGCQVTKTVTIDVSSAVAAYELVAAYVCPPGKRAYLISAQMATTSSHSLIAIGTEGSTTEYGPLSSYTADAKFVALSSMPWIPAGQCLGGIGTGQVGDTAIKFYYIVTEVDW